MEHKCKKCKEGSPEWVVTFSDMMSLLMAFFVILISMSSIKKDEFRAEGAAIKTAIVGVTGGAGPLAATGMTLFQKLNAMAAMQATHRNHSNTDQAGMSGKEATVTRIREGSMFAVGGRITFDPGSADLSEQDKRQLRAVADLIRGTTNIVELRGDAATMELGRADDRFASLWDLSYARARSVLRYLTSEAVGLKANRFRLVANADREPLVQREYSAAGEAPNRRVEVIVTEALVEQFQKPEANTGS